MADIKFIPRWTTQIIPAQAGGYKIGFPFIPVCEVYSPYKYGHLSTDQAIKVEAFENAVEVLATYGVHNIDMGQFVLNPGTYEKRFFDVANVSASAGDYLLVLKEIGNG